jgi:hypothetical protein
MNPLEFALVWLLGGTIGVALITLFFPPTRRHVGRNACVVVGIAIAMAFYRHLTLDASAGLALSLLFVFWVIGWAFGWAGGSLLERLLGYEKTG